MAGIEQHGNSGGAIFPNVVKVEVWEDRAAAVTVLFDPGHSLEERILMEQFQT